jgi:hypothetical protein
MIEVAWTLLYHTALEQAERDTLSVQDRAATASAKLPKSMGVKSELPEKVEVLFRTRTIQNVLPRRP